MANEHTDKLVQKYTSFRDTAHMLTCIRNSQQPLFLDLSEDDPRQKVVLAQFIKEKTGVVCHLINPPLNGTLWKTIQTLGLTSLDHKRFLAKSKTRGATR